MKTKTIFIALFILIAKQSFSQGFYVGAQGGYALPFLVQTITANQTSTSNYSSSGYSSSSTNDKVFSNFGSGATVGLLVGYTLKSNISFELGYSTFFTSSFQRNYTSNDYTNGTLTSSISNQTTFNSQLNNFSAGVKYSNKFSFGEPYIKAGLLVGIPSFTTNEQTNNTSSTSQLIEVETKYTGSLTVGAFTAIGIKENLSPSLSFFAEVVVNMIHFNPAKSVITKSTLNGVDQLPSMNTSQKETEYVNSYSSSSTSSGSSSDSNNPRKALITDFNFSNIGLQVGLIYYFTKREVKKK